VELLLSVGSRLKICILDDAVKIWMEFGNVKKGRDENV